VGAGALDGGALQRWLFVHLVRPVDEGFNLCHRYRREVLEGIAQDVGYHAALEEERRRLMEHVRCTTSVLEASTAFVRTHRPSDTPGGVEAAVLTLMQEAHTR
jgi:hypothetical protein